MARSTPGVPQTDDGIPASHESASDVLVPTHARRALHAWVWAIVAIGAIVAAGLSIPFLKPVLRPGINNTVGSMASVRGDTVLVTQSIVELAATPYATVAAVTSIPGLTLVGAWLDPVADPASAELPATTSVDLDAITNDPASVPPTGLPARVHTGTYVLSAAWQVTGCDQAPPTDVSPPALIFVNVFGSRIESDPDDAFPILASPGTDAGPRWCEMIYEQATESGT